MNNLEGNSFHVYNNVMEAMQEAEEMGGVNDSVEYAQLMKAISNECLKRIETALSHATDEETEKIYALLTKNKLMLDIVYR
jgi:hypothetical protein